MSTFDGDSPWALADRFVHAAVEAKLFGTVSEPIEIGRYRAVRPLGAGGMGQLVLAYDPSLQRRVALKLLAPHLTDSSEARTRIVREARAMARLSDPHIAQVYETGEADGRLFVAMEYVEGETLRAWLDAEPRSVREIVGVFLQAGAGLAAAHEKGLVHRDFKPDNVMLEQGGRARVVDFGLAQAGTARAPRTEPALVLPDPRAGSSGQVTLTHAGTRLGTPAYMAPEQWSGAEVTPRSDQFSFCVALFEALASRRPYAGDTPATIHASLARGEIAPLPSTVPRWLARLLRRGLALDPADRFSDMRALLLALDPARRVRRRRFAIVGALLVLLPLGVAVLRRDPCRNAGAPIHASFGAEAREALSAALTRLDPPWIDATARALLPRLDDHADAWGQAARAVCATGRHDAARVGCLAYARARLEEILQRIETGDPSLVVNAVAEAELLPDPRTCLEAPPLSAFTNDPAATAVASRETLAHLVRLEQSLGALSTTRAFTAAIAEGRTAAEQAVTAAQAIDHLPLLARALWLRGRLLQRDGDAIRAEAALRRALVLAHEAREDRLAAAIAIDLVYAVSRDRDRGGGEAQALADEARARLVAIGEPPVLAARLRSHRGSALAHARKADRQRAVEEHEHAVALLTQSLGPSHPDVLAALGNLGTALSYAGRPADAEARLEQAIASAERVFGPEHPRTAVLLGTLGLARLRQDDLEAAEQHLRRALALQEAALGPEHADVDRARYNLVSALRRRKHHDEAVRLLELGLAHRRRVHDPAIAPWHVALGESLLALGRLAEARTQLETALRRFERLGASAGDFAQVRLSLARTMITDDPARARVLAELARDDAREAGLEDRIVEIDLFLEGP